MRIYVIGTLLLLISDLKTFNSSVQLLFGWQPYWCLVPTEWRSRNRRWLMILLNNLSSGSFRYMPRQFEGFFLNPFLCKHLKFTSYHYLGILLGLSKLRWSYLGAFDIGSLHYYIECHISHFTKFLRRRISRKALRKIWLSSEIPAAWKASTCYSKPWLEFFLVKISRIFYSMIDFYYHQHLWKCNSSWENTIFVWYIGT